MPEVNKFEDLMVWQKARQLTREIYKVTNLGNFSQDFGLKSQIQRASISIMSNIAEGFERWKPGEFHQFVSIAKGSCAEVRCQLYIALDNKYIEESEFNSIMKLSQEIGKMLGKLRVTIEKKKF